MNIKKKATIVALSASMLATPAIVGAAPTQFKDMKKEDSHYGAVMDLVKQGAISGYEDGTFKPYQNISRQHVAVILARSLSLPIPNDAETKKLLSQYSDVTPKHEYAKQIAAVTKAKVFSGNNGKFLPSQDITREQMATVLTKGFGLTNYQQDKVQVNLKNVDKSHQGSVQAIANLDITVALSNFKPQDKLKRGQFASFLIRTQDVIANGKLVGDDKPGTGNGSDKPSNGGNDNGSNNEGENTKPETPITITGFDMNLTSSIVEGNSVNIQLIAKKSDGSKTDVSTKASFVAGDSSIIKITGNKVTGLKAGKSTITATYENNRVQTEIEVTAKPPVTDDNDNGGVVEGESGKLSIDGRGALDINKTTELNFTLFDKDGNNVGELTSEEAKEVKGVADNPSLVKIEGAKVTGLKVGYTDINFTYKGYKGTFRMVVVDQGPDEDLWGYFRIQKIKADYYIRDNNGTQDYVSGDIAKDADMTLSATQIKQAIGEALSKPNTAINRNDSVFYYDKANNEIIVKWLRTGDVDYDN